MDGHSKLLRDLYNQGKIKWAIFLIGLAFLAWLWVKAAQPRHAGAIKHSWSVKASRVLAIAGGILYGRLIFASREQRVPVLYFDGLSRASQEVVEAIKKMTCLKDHGFEDVPIDDIVSFIRDNRYVPKRAFGLVVRIGTIDQLRAILGENPPHLTILFPAEAMRKQSLERIELPYRISPGVFSEKPDLGIQDLKEISQNGSWLFGKPIDCALIPDASQEELKNMALRSGYRCFFNGDGFNRFGDRPHLVRLLDATGIVNSKNYRPCLYYAVQLFMGRFIFWPTAVLSGLRKVIE